MTSECLKIPEEDPSVLKLIELQENYFTYFVNTNISESSKKVKIVKAYKHKDS